MVCAWAVWCGWLAGLLGGVVDLGVVVLVCIVYRVVLMRGGGIGWGMTVFWLFSGGCVVWFAEEWVCIAGSDGLSL